MLMGLRTTGKVDDKTIASGTPASQVTVDAGTDDVDYVTSLKLANASFHGKYHKNLLYHSLTHDIWQEGTTFNDIADDTYVADLWTVLHNGQPPDISGQANSAGDPFKRSFRCTFDSASSQAGIVQFLRTGDTYPLQVDPVVSLSFDAWGNSGVTALRAAVIYWTGVPDSLTSDVVGTWATGNQTLATDWAYANTPAADITITTTRDRYKIENITIPSTADNIAVFIWTPNAQASGNLWNIANVQLERGPVATEFVARLFTEELILSLPFFTKSYQLATPPGTVTVIAVQEIKTRDAIAASVAGTLRVLQRFNVPMRTTPTVTLYSFLTGTAGAVVNATTGLDRTGATAEAATLSEMGISAITIDNTNANPIALDDLIVVHFKADARL